jgi:hypothetical protein
MLGGPSQSECIPKAIPTPLSVLQTSGSGSSPATETVTPPSTPHGSVLTVMIVGSPH